MDGDDIRGMLERAASEAGIPLELLLAGAIAESGLNPRAERWGLRTREALESLNQGDWPTLQAIIDDVWPDCSWGYAQRICRYHYLGDQSATVNNCLAVREAVLDDPQRDLYEMALDLADDAADVYGCDLSPVDGDALLAALVIYNAGHWPDPSPRRGGGSSGEGT